MAKARAKRTATLFLMRAKCSSLLLLAVAGCFSWIAFPGPGMAAQLIGTAFSADAQYDLSALGTVDWAHWGRGGVLVNVDRKSSVVRSISNVSKVGTWSGGAAKAPVYSANWTDGTPTASATNETGFIFNDSTSLNGGFSFTVPADTTARTLFVYCGGRGSFALLQAHLSDNSAPDLYDVRSSTGRYRYLYQITFQAASAGQTLKISWLKTAENPYPGGSVDLKAACLTEGIPLAIRQIETAGTNLELTVTTPDPVRSHTLQIASSLAGSEWTDVTNASFLSQGNTGLLATVPVPAPAAPAAFYRLSTAPPLGPLRVHPDNRRYFTDGRGKAIYLTGAHTWNNLQDLSTNDPPQAFDFTAYLDFLEQHNLNFIRLWRWELTGYVEAYNQKRFYCAPHPWQRSGPGLALDGKPRFDLTKFDEAYFQRLHSRVEEAGRRGIYVSIMLFEGWGIRFEPNGWTGHPFNALNNINGINGDPNSDGGLGIFRLVNPGVTRVQEAYVRKVIDTVNDLDNVLYEVSNENQPEANSWQVYFIHYIHQYERSKPRQHPVGMTSTGFGGDDDTDSLFNSPADWISPSPDRDDYKQNPPAATGAKVIIPDTDHLWGLGGDRLWAWKSFLRGLNPIFMDPYQRQVLDGGPDQQWEIIRRALGDARGFAERMDLAKVIPRNDLASTAYCLANPGVEYLVYQPVASAAFNVQLQAATYRYEWFNPATNALAEAGTIAAATGTREFKAPFGGDAVLYLKAQQ